MPTRWLTLRSRPCYSADDEKRSDGAHVTRVRISRRTSIRTAREVLPATDTALKRLRYVFPWTTPVRRREAYTSIPLTYVQTLIPSAVLVLDKQGTRRLVTSSPPCPSTAEPSGPLYSHGLYPLLLLLGTVQRSRPAHAKPGHKEKKHVMPAQRKGSPI